jgi:hypothetical protein
MPSIITVGGNVVTVANATSGGQDALAIPDTPLAPHTSYVADSSTDTLKSSNLIRSVSVTSTYTFSLLNASCVDAYFRFKSRLTPVSGDLNETTFSITEGTSTVSLFQGADSQSLNDIHIHVIKLPDASGNTYYCGFIEFGQYESSISFVRYLINTTSSSFSISMTGETTVASTGVSMTATTAYAGYVTYLY